MDFIIGLLLLFSNFGSFSCIISLTGDTVGLVIVTIICILIAWSAISYLRIEGMGYIIGFVAIIQVVIFGTIETLYYEEGYIEWHFQWVSAYFSQLLVYLIGYYWIAKEVKKIFDNKAIELCTKVKYKLEAQVKALIEIDFELSNKGVEYKNTEHLLTLLKKLSDDTLGQAYISARAKKDYMILEHINEISLSNNLKIDTNGKTLSSIQCDINEKLQEKRELLEKIHQKIFKKYFDFGSYRWLKYILKMLNE